MKNILKRPSVNALCLGVFSAFYASIFLLTAQNNGFKDLQVYTDNTPSFWKAWSDFLASGYQAYIAYATTALTILVITLLLKRHRPYDEYHTSLLASCLAVAIVLALLAIAVFYLIILNDPTGVVAKFTLFVTINWVTVVLADLVFVLLCQWR